MLRIDYKGSNCKSRESSQEAITVSQARGDRGFAHGNSVGDEK